MKAKFWRCKWCIARTGTISWFNERGQTVILPAWAIPTEKETSDGICPKCLTEELSHLPPNPLKEATA